MSVLICLPIARTNAIKARQAARRLSSSEAVTNAADDVDVLLKALEESYQHHSDVADAVERHWARR